MNAPTPIPLRADIHAANRSAVTSLVRAAIVEGLRISDRHAAAEAAKTWSTDRDFALLSRSAVSPTALSNTGTLANVAQAFLATLRPLSAGADLLARGLQLTFGGAASISVPGIGPVSADFVREGAPFPVQQADTSIATTLAPYSIKFGAGATSEMLRSPSAESLIRQVLLDATGPALDRVLFSTAAAVPNERPAGLLHNVTPITGTAGGGLNALVGDLKAMAVALAAVAGNSQVVLVAAAEQAVSLALLPPGGSPYIPLRR